MTEYRQRPFGTWPSDITAELLVGDSIRLSEPRIDGNMLYWLESRPLQKGRTCIVRKALNQVQTTADDILPYPISTRSKVHEYGGASYTVHNGIVYFVAADDQCIYRLNTCHTSAIPEAITEANTRRYANLIIDAQRNRLICVSEDTSDQTREPSSSLISIDLHHPHSIKTIASGADFYASPSLAPSGKSLTWLQWHHPNMPWDHTQCCIADLHADGSLLNSEIIAGAQQAESVFQPQWSPTGDLYLVSDRSDWWNIYRYNRASKSLENICPLNAEFATPQWVFGMSTYGFIDAHTLASCHTQQGRWQLLLINTETGAQQALTTPYSDISDLVCSPLGMSWLGASEEQAGAIVYCTAEQLLNGDEIIHPITIQASAHNQLPNTWFSKPEAITFPTGNQQQAYGFFYPPRNPNVKSIAGEKPPLIVLCHGGPTGATSSALNLKIQFWTSRGFAVLDVNYRGSTGYGREFRQSLHNAWGIADVEDVCAGANYVAEKGWADNRRLIIKGSSAGGYTVLAALTFTNTFSLGTSLYGIGDLETLAKDTHKFESRYLDSLVGPYPEQQALYRARSPIYHVEQLNCPVIFFQGLEDKVVPPEQAQTMVSALKKKGIPVAYIEFKNEGHGFRQAESITQMLEAEWAFYKQQLKLEG